MGMNVDRSGSFTRVTAEGLLSREALEETISALMGNGRAAPHVDLLWDLRAARLNEINGTDVRRLAALVSAKGRHCRGCKAAILVADDVGFGIGRMWELLTEDDLPIHSRVFRSAAEAEAWLEAQEIVSSL